VRNRRAWNVKRHRAFAFSDSQHLFGGHVKDVSIGIDEAPDRPWTSDTIDLRSLACDPTGWTPISKEFTKRMLRLWFELRV
jgi:hypothetical protein